MLGVSSCRPRLGPDRVHLSVPLRLEGPSTREAVDQGLGLGGESTGRRKHHRACSHLSSWMGPRNPGGDADGVLKRQAQFPERLGQLIEASIVLQALRSCAATGSGAPVEVKAQDDKGGPDPPGLSQRRASDPAGSEQAPNPEVPRSTRRVTRTTRLMR